jgi:hypothetical protein
MDKAPPFASHRVPVNRLWCDAQAEPLHINGGEIRLVALGEKHPVSAASLNNLAVLYAAIKRYEEAERLLLASMELRRAAFGEGHPAYTGSLNNLAVLHRAIAGMPRPSRV